MKTARLFALLFFIPLTFHAQKSLTGLWMGTLSNDSSTVRKDQSFEMVLTQYKQKVYGYSRSTFIVNDTLYYILKRVKGTIIDDVCEVKDDEIISFNFRGKLDKGIKLTTTFRMNKNDSTWALTGDWNTNKTKKFYAITGKVEMKDEPDVEKSKILPHLEELNLAKEVPFYVEAKQKEEAKRKDIAVITKSNPTANKLKDPVILTPDPVSKPKQIPATRPEIKKQEPVAVVEEKKPVVTEPKKQEPVAIIEEKKETPKPIVTTPEPKKQEPIAIVEEKKEPAKPVVTKPEPKKQEPVAIVEEKKPVVTEPKKQEPVAIIEEKKKEPLPVNKPITVPGAAVAVTERRTAAPQEVDFVSDSLELSLYDNGEVDGDTVSVLMNGQVILAKQGLKTTAIKKTIYMPPGTDEVTLVLYAENLGKYPPNTGLLVVHDGEERYQVRFSADLQQNASVIFRRKRK